MPNHPLSERTNTDSYFFLQVQYYKLQPNENSAFIIFNTKQDSSNIVVPIINLKIKVTDYHPQNECFLKLFIKPNVTSVFLLSILQRIFLVAEKIPYFKTSVFILKINPTKSFWLSVLNVLIFYKKIIYLQCILTSKQKISTVMQIF